MSTLAVIGLILAVVVIAAYVFIIAIAVTAGRADEALERMHEGPPPGSVQAAVDELGAEADAAWPVASVESVWPRRKRGGGWVSS